MRDKMLFIIFMIGIISIYASCRDKKVDKTIDKGLKAIKDRDYASMCNLIGTGVTQDTFLYGIVDKVVEISYFLDKYHSGSVENLKILRSNEIDESGRNVITIPIYEGYDSATGLSDVRIVFNVGPFNLFPADKLTGFSVERNVDVKRRSYLIDNNLLTYDFDSVSNVEYQKLLK